MNYIRIQSQSCISYACLKPKRTDPLNPVINTMYVTEQSNSQSITAVSILFVYKLSFTIIAFAYNVNIPKRSLKSGVLT